MSKITSGKVTFGRTVNLGDYNSKRMDVELSFIADEGEDAMGVAVEAAAQARRLCLATIAAKDTDAVKAPAAAAASVPETPPKKPVGRPPATRKEEPKPEPTKDDLSIPAGLRRAPDSPPAATAADPLANVEMTEESEELFDEASPEAQPEISDVAMASAMNRKMAELKPKHQGAAPGLIRKLINQFVEPPKKSADIPQNLRAEFLKKLAELG